MTQVITHFPYGTFPVDSSVRDHYNQAPLSQTYPLPDVLPMHHPLLQQLEDTYPVVDTLPLWWTHFIEDQDPVLKPLLQAVTIREFREGVLDQQRWLSWKRGLSLQEQEMFQTTSIGNNLMHSPKLAALVSGDQKEWFEERGPKDTPLELDLVISFRPQYLLTMSNGNGWMSCLHLYEGYEHERLPSNWYDTGLAVAMVAPRGADIWQGIEQEREGVVLARTTLRVFTDHENTPVIVIGRCFDNNKTLVALLLSRLISFFQQQRLSWGSMPYHTLTRVLKNGFIGSYREEQQELRSVAFWHPSGVNLPYIDGIIQWSHTDDDFTFLTANIHRWLP